MTDNVTPLREPGVLPRQPPINVEAEQHLLGAFLCDNRLLEVIADFLRPEHFANATHARIFDAIQKYVDRGQTANVVTLKATFDQETALAPIGGAKYLARLAGGGAHLARVEVQHYARHVYDYWQRRQLINFGEDSTSTERMLRFRESGKAKTRGAASPAKPALHLVSSKPNGFCASQDETHLKRDKTQRTTPDSEGDSETPPTPPPGVVKASSEKLDAGKDGTRAFARAGSAISEDERKKLAHDRVIQQVIAQAALTMRTDKYEEFALALCEEQPPPWACSERDRIWRQIKRERNASGAAHAA
jgi:hypothetical protein